MAGVCWRNPKKVKTAIRVWWHQIANMIKKTVPDTCSHKLKGPYSQRSFLIFERTLNVYVVFFSKLHTRWAYGNRQNDVLIKGNIRVSFRYTFRLQTNLLRVVVLHTTFKGSRNTQWKFVTFLLRKQFEFKIGLVVDSCTCAEIWGI